MGKRLFISIFLLCLLGSTAWAQDRRVIGKVTSAEDGSPLPGVSILVKGTSKGTTTDGGGVFDLMVPSTKGTILVFSFVGTTTQEILVGNQSEINVSLVSDSKLLTEVVVTGSGIETSKAKLGIAVESVSGKNLPQTPTASIDQALIGKIPGAQISSVSGNPGDPVNILLRGINSVQGGTKPLIMVDGVQVAATDINSLDLSNVDRIEVAQGAASASIYGAQGANGVIQIFTKKGKKGRVSINASTSYSTNEFLNTGNVHKADLHPYLTDGSNNLVDSKGNILKYTDYGSVLGLSYQYGGATRYAIQDIRNVADKPYNANLKYYDHFKQIFQTGTTTNNAINISGASEKSDFNISVANNHNVTPILKNGYIDRSNLSANVGTELFKGFTIRSTTQLVYTKNTLKPGLGAAGGRYYGLGNSLGNIGRVYGFLNTSPFFDLTARMADGNYPYKQLADFVSINANDPFYNLQYTDGLDNKVDVIQNFSANYKVNKFVELDAKYGINYRNENARWTYYNQSQNASAVFFGGGNFASNFAPDNTGEIDNYQYTTTFQNFLATAYLRTDFQNDFHINLPIQTSTQVSFDYRKNKYTEFDTYGVGLGLAPPYNIKSTNSQAVDFDYVRPFVTYGYLVNQKIDFGDYGGVTAGFRSDWSSAFGGGSTPFTFPHFDGHIAPLSFFKNSGLSSALPYFKLRAAYGEAGIQPGAFDRYPVLDQQNIGTGSGIAYSVQPTSNNPNLQVEVSKEFEVGTDFTIGGNANRAWLNSISGSFTYWKRKSENVIYTVSVPPSLGSTGQLTNAIDMSSNGVQFSLTFPIYNSKGLKWDLTTNFGHQLSKIDAISGGADIILTTSAGSTALVLTPGQPIGQVYGYKALTSLDYLRQDGKTRYIQPGNESQYTIVDGRVVNKTTYQMQFTDETYPLMNPNPKFNMSFINGVSFKDFLTLNFQFDWVNGSHLYNQTKEWMYRDGISGDFTKPVTIDGKTGAYTAYWSSAYYNLWGSLRGAGNNATKDFFVEDASFVRLRNISLAFDLAKVVKIPALNKCQIVFTGRNILTFTKYSGYDPEISSGSPNSSFDRGVDHSTLPNTKSYQVGLNIGF
ncbi:MULTISPECIES: SusC/RagA family TonB-linked outer membrane protein [unclassified Spirosoma]|uniref:SusC/RagA family TonB-linked outer membrane protein n=1 Tax=unclassified Spirosoma TaxID=2621999 RepID=UPI00096828F1|nr:MULTISPECIES: SusC/RagA family TonB-linked outer membrane protein [unclassified Spirosoma]MBN8822183.1 SusC/RagA family TonB-linked outer membrane protein [Spirosoma sp.]OJW80576.1 MAG: SusC/RagA family TonB-linked outer membrane protein [Spirosoma sp. 48-14]